MTSTTTRVSAAVDRSWSDHVLVWGRLVAWGLLVHKARHEDWAGSIDQVAVTWTAVACVWRPTTTKIAVFASALLVQTMVDLPYVVNHWLLVAVMMTVYLASVVFQLVRYGSVTTDRVARHCFPALRGAVYLLFVVAFVAKVNRGFIDFTASCAVDHYELLRERLIVLPAARGWIAPALIAGTLLIELVIPLLLAMRRTRAVGIAIAIGFHLLMGLNPFFTFSAPAFAMYVPFVPAQLGHRIDELRARWKPGRAAAFDLLLPVTAIGLAGAGTVSDVIGSPITTRPGQAVFIVVGLTVAAVAMRAWPRDEPPRWPPAAAGRAARVLMFVVAGGLVVNSALPYLGPKTQTSFTMFSNLRTEEGEWNHLFIPESVRVSGAQDELYRVLEAPDRFSTLPPGVVEDEDGDEDDNDVRIVRHELLRAIDAACGSGPVPLVVEDGNGVVVTSADACSDARFAPIPGALARKLILFRPIMSTERCQH